MKYKDLENEWSQYWFQLIFLYTDEDLDWVYISKNPNLTWEIIQQNPDKPWDWSMVSSNPNITWEIISNQLTDIYHLIIGPKLNYHQTFYHDLH